MKFPLIVMKLEDLRKISPESVTREELTLIAGRIALMHKVLQQYPNKNEIRRAEFWDTQQSNFREFLKSPNAEAFKAWELQELHELDLRIEAACRKVRLALPLTKSVLHGDLNLDHVRLLCGTGDPYFLDFSDFSYGPIALDLAILLVHLFRESDISSARWEEHKGWVLDGYGAVQELAENDISAIDSLLLPWTLTEVRYLNKMSMRTRGEQDVRGIRRRYQLMEYLLNKNAAAGAPADPRKSGSNPSGNQPIRSHDRGRPPTPSGAGVG
jgi:Ser/Thr protein kinase RdoA (MazF antagonist)